MPDGTRLVFWLDVLLVVVLMILALAQQWDFVVALLIAMVVMNTFDRLASRHRH